MTIHVMVRFYRLRPLILIALGVIPLLSVGQSNLEKFTPSALFQKGQWEVNTFHNLYTQASVRNREGEEMELGQRQTFINSQLQFTYGSSESGRLNVGLDVIVTRAYYGESSSGPHQIFTSNGDFQRTVVSAVGPRIKYQPLLSLPSFSVQSSFLFPTAEGLESPFFTAHDRYSWITQVFYDHRISSKWRAFFSLDFLARFKTSDVQRTFLRLPASVFLSYFPSSKYSIFTSLQYSPRFESVSNSIDEQFGLNQWFTTFGFGGKYQATRKLSFELSYSNFVLSRNDGAGYSVNFGLRIISG